MVYLIGIILLNLIIITLRVHCYILSIFKEQLQFILVYIRLLISILMGLLRLIKAITISIELWLFNLRLI